MKLLKIFKATSSSNGFALIEIVIGLGILVFILSAGLFVNLNSISQRNFFAEEELISSLLKTARSRAVNNINETSHGFYLSETDFVIFEGDFKNQQSFKRNSQVEVTTSWPGDKVIFKNLTGEPTEAGEIKINDKTMTFDIKINEAGGIN